METPIFEFEYPPPAAQRTPHTTAHPLFVSCNIAELPCCHAATTPELPQRPPTQGRTHETEIRKFQLLSRTCCFTEQRCLLHQTRMNLNQRRAFLDGAEVELLKLVLNGATPEQWAEWLRAPLEHAAVGGNYDLVDRFRAGANGSAGWRGCRARTLLDAAALGGNGDVGVCHPPSRMRVGSECGI